MRRWHFPSILRCGFEQMSALSRVLSESLWHGQSRQQRPIDYESGNLAHPADQLVWQLQRSARKQANQRKDSRIGGPTDTPVETSIQRSSAVRDHGSAHPSRIIPSNLTQSLRILSGSSQPEQG